MEVEVERQKRQVDMFSRPEVLDYAYNARQKMKSNWMFPWANTKMNWQEGTD